MPKRPAPPAMPKTPAPPVSSPKPIQIEKEVIAPIAISISSTTEKFACPNCGKMQNPDRTICWSCGTPFYKI